MKNTIPLIACIAGLATAAVAQPAYMNYQGRLLDTVGQPLTNGSYSLEFNIYNSANGTNLVWGPFLCDDGIAEGHATRAVVANGRFNVILGPNDTAGRALTAAFWGNDRYFEIKVNGGDPILPRQQVLSAPYAIQSTSARTAEVASNIVQQVADVLCPPGTIVAFGGAAVPAGWLPCNGSSLPTTGNYARLFTAIGYSWGGSGGSFNLPDLRGMFLRGVNAGRTGIWADPDGATRTIGSLQPSTVATHNHRWSVMTGSGRSSKVSSWTSSGYAEVMRHTISGDAPNTGGDDDDFVVSPSATDFNVFTDPYSTIWQSYETRPNNACVNYIIKY